MIKYLHKISWYDIYILLLFIGINKRIFFFILTTFQELFQIVIGAIIIPAYLLCVQLSRLYPTANGLYACIEFLANFFQIIQLYIWYFNQSLSPHFITNVH